MREKIKEKTLKYKYLNKQDKKIIYDEMTNFIKYRNIKNYNFDYNSLKKHYFDYYEIFLYPMLSDGYNPDNIYYHIDKFLDENIITMSAPALRNTMMIILKSLLNRYKLPEKFDNMIVIHLTSMCEKSRKSFLNEYNNNKYYFSEKVINDCEWMVNETKYNRIIKLNKLTELTELTESL